MYSQQHYSRFFRPEMNRFLNSSSTFGMFDNNDTERLLTNLAYRNEYQSAHPIQRVINPKGFAQGMADLPYNGAGGKTGVLKANPGLGVSGGSIPLSVAGDAMFDAGVEKALGAKTAKGATAGAKAATGAGGLKGLWTKSVKPNFGWSGSTGLKAFGKDLGGWTGAGTIIPGIMYGTQAIGNLQDLKDASASTEDLLNDIAVSAANNPIVNSYLTSDQKSLLRKVKNGKLSGDTNVSIGDIMPDDLSDVLDIGKGVLTGIAGGIPGMVVGGVGSALNSSLEGNLQDLNLQNAELEALLQALEDAEMQYQSMKRPNFTGLGIQQRYQNMYM